MPLNNLLCGLLETGVNQLHQLDISAEQKRKQLNGTIIGVTLQELNKPLYFVISKQQVDVLSVFEGPTDCFIRVSFNALHKLQDNLQLTTLIKTGQLEVEGDIQLVQKFAQLLTDMDIDWEEHLSHKVGDIVAHKVCCHIKQLHHAVISQFKATEKQTALYITEELKLAPGGLEVAYFCEQVKALEDKTNKLIQKFNKQLNAN